MNDSLPDSPSRLPGRLRILSAAEKVFVQEGVEGARMDAIASVAGVSRSHLYYHFKSRDEIFDAVVERRTSDILAAKAALIDELGGAESMQTPADSERVIRAAIEIVMEPHREFFRLLVAEAIRRPELPSAMLGLIEGVVGDTLERLGGTESVAPEDITEVFYLLMVPALIAVVLPSDPTGTLTSPADIAPLLTRARTLLFPPGTPRH
ncbi:MAG: helix-turn-helix domain-containing protein [Propionicimonas sp.]